MTSSPKLRVTEAKIISGNRLQILLEGKMGEWDLIVVDNAKSTKPAEQLDLFRNDEPTLTFPYYVLFGNNRIFTEIHAHNAFHATNKARVEFSNRWTCVSKHKPTELYSNFGANWKEYSNAEVRAIFKITEPEQATAPRKRKTTGKAKKKVRK